MSNLLKEAIVDAQALREAALKNAEAAIVDKYSTEVRETLEQLLEQDEPRYYFECLSRQFFVQRGSQSPHKMLQTSMKWVLNYQ